MKTRHYIEQNQMPPLVPFIELHTLCYDKENFLIQNARLFYECKMESKINVEPQKTTRIANTIENTPYICEKYVIKKYKSEL